MRTSDLDYTLPADRIAQEPIEPRDAARLLHVARDGSLDDLRFTNLPELLQPGDLLIANETRVRRARLHARTGDGREVELLVLEERGDGVCLCLAGPARLAAVGAALDVDGVRVTVDAIASEHRGARLVRFHTADVGAAIERSGASPLPPYIHTPLTDGSRYQTLYAAGPPRSAAAPTAGLHFTPRVMEALRRRGVGWVTLRLEVGLATFAPMRVDDIDDHPMHEERYELPETVADAVRATRRAGGRIIAVGTTSMRVLETCAAEGGTVRAGSGATRLFIKPGHRFRVVDGLLTNFHQPRSSLLVLLAAFAGDSTWRLAYAHALAHAYRFLSFGDCMLCWRSA